MSELMDKALEEMKNIAEYEISDDISNILQILKDYDVNTLINLEISSQILPNNMEKQLILIAQKLKSENFGKEDVNLLARLLKINQFFANKSISDDTLVFLSPISAMLYYLQIRPDLLSRIVDKEQLSKINDSVFEFFNKLDDSFNVPKTASDFEQEAFKRYRHGVHQEDLNSIYFFIENVERRIGIYPNFFVTFLARLLLIEPSKYFSFIESIKEPYLIVKYINIIENKLKKNFFKILHSSNNKWLVFEYLRQIFKELPFEGNLKGEEIESISLLFGRLYDFKDEKFLIHGLKFLTKFKNKKYLGLCTGTFLSNCDETSLIKKLVEAMEINERTLNLDFWTFIGKVLEKENKELLEYMGQFIFIKWDKFFKDLFMDEKIVLGIIFTDYLNIVIWYLQDCLSKDKSKFLNLLEEKLDSIINYKSFWIKYPSRKRFIWLSYVYKMSEAWKNVLNSEIEVETLKNKILFILNDERMFLSLQDYEGSHKHILKIKNNFGLLN